MFFLTYFFVELISIELDPQTSYLGGPVNITKNNVNMTIEDYEMANEEKKIFASQHWGFKKNISSDEPTDNTYSNMHFHYNERALLLIMSFNMLLFIGMINFRIFPCCR